MILKLNVNNIFILSYYVRVTSRSRTCMHLIALIALCVFVSNLFICRHVGADWIRALLANIAIQWFTFLLILFYLFFFLGLYHNNSVTCIALKLHGYGHMTSNQRESHPCMHSLLNNLNLENKLIYVLIDLYYSSLWSFLI